MRSPGRHAPQVQSTPDVGPAQVPEAIPAVPEVVAPAPMVGWREWARLPTLAAASMIKAKVDTGATTSAIHVEKLDLHDAADGQAFASFELNLADDPDEHTVVEHHPVAAFRFVRSSSGHGTYRPVIHTSLQLGQQVFDIDVTLTGRDEMGFKMLIGRSALRGRFIVDPSGSFLQGKRRQLLAAT